MVPDWFLDAKLGIFIHWGIYAVDGIDESWEFHNGKISHRDYMNQLDRFTASNWDPDVWAELFVRSGAKYAVLTSKHHDGVALFDTKQVTPSLRNSWPKRGLAERADDLGHEDDSKPLSTVHQTPAGRDLIRPYLESLRRAGLRTGIYFSHLDWSHGDYASPIVDAEKDNRFEFRRPDSDPQAWRRFREFHFAQLEELCNGYGDLDLLWFDGDWEGTDEAWEMAALRAQLKRWQPNMVVNSRMRGHGDYDTPEQGLPVDPPTRPWEFCMTINDSWGYQGRDSNFKTPTQVIRLFAEIVGMGGNLLLDIGPCEDGSIQNEQLQILESLGDWIRPNVEAIHGTRAGLSLGHFFGPSTLSKDRKILYLIVFGDGGGTVSVRGLRNGVTKVTEVNSGAELEFRRNGGAGWMSVPGVLWIDLLRELTHPVATVIKVELEEEIDLYRGAGQGVS